MKIPRPQGPGVGSAPCFDAKHDERQMIRVSQEQVDPDHWAQFP